MSNNKKPQSTSLVDKAKNVSNEDNTSNDNTEVHQRFWGVTMVHEKKPATFTLERTELHVTQVAIAVPSTSATNDNQTSILYASTKLIKDIPICTLSHRTGPRQCLVDLNFFPHDELVTFRVEGPLPLSLAGTIAIFGGQLLVSDDEDEEGEQEDNDQDDEDDEDEEMEEDEEDDDEEEEEIISKPTTTTTKNKPLTATEKLLKRKREEQEQQQQISSSKPKTNTTTVSSSSSSSTYDLGTITTSKGTSNVQINKPDANNNNKKRKEEQSNTKPNQIQPNNKDLPVSPTNSMMNNNNSDVKSLANGKIKYMDITQGTGNIATNGQRVTVAYEGRLKNGKVFDKGSKFTFRLGKKEVIKGWDLGVAGMHIGGKRKLIIHPELAYGSMGSPPVIPPNSTLIFDVTLLKIQ